MQQIEHIKEFGGWLNRYRHASRACDSEMTLSVYLPPAAEQGPVPAVYYLSGLTCTDDNVRVKAGAQRYAAELGLALVMPDTSPRGDQVADAPERYALGQGAGFYLNATQAPWDRHYQMFDYVTDELPTLLEAALALLPGLRSITGHSMGGHGALICALMHVIADTDAAAAEGDACNAGRNAAEFPEVDASPVIADGAAGAVEGQCVGRTLRRGDCGSPLRKGRDRLVNGLACVTGDLQATATHRGSIGRGV
jgi:hypothetical protein